MDEPLTEFAAYFQKEQASMIRRCIIWRNNHAYDERLRALSTGRTSLDTAQVRGHFRRL
jgi:hypothetical protein